MSHEKLIGMDQLDGWLLKPKVTPSLIFILKGDRIMNESAVLKKVGMTVEKNQYWIDKHRYYELKHFCLQYPWWKKAYAGLDSYINGMAGDTNGFIKSGGHSDPTSKCAEKRAFYSNQNGREGCDGDR